MPPSLYQSPPKKILRTLKPTKKKKASTPKTSSPSPKKKKTVRITPLQLPVSSEKDRKLRDRAPKSVDMKAVMLPFDKG